MEIFLLFWIVCGVFSAMVAGSKGRNGCAWAIGGFLFGPLALIAVGLMAPAVTASPVQVQPLTQSSEPRVACPYCAEMILPAAKVCRYCGKELTPPPVLARATGNANPAATSYRTCLNCKTPNDWNATICEECGQPLRTSKPSALGPVTATESKICGKCGERNTGTTLYCVVCQTRL